MPPSWSATHLPWLFLTEVFRGRVLRGLDLSPPDPPPRRVQLRCLDEDQELQARARVATVLDDKWTLERLLGVGGMAAVYAARHRNGARAAVKILHPQLSRYAEVRERFQREGYAANQVDHPGVVKVLDDDVVSTGPEAGTAYLVMELLEGQSMQDRLERGPAMSELEFLGIADCVLDVLCAAHAHGVVHRDLKPENLFLVREDAPAPSGARVKVLDFGLARLLQGQAITTYGLALGTPSFMSPEQAAGRLDEIDGRTDLFALAATGFRLRTGRRIHEGANAVELVTKMANLPAPPIRSIAADVSAPFARIVDRALAFRRDDRYATAAEMQADVRRATKELDEVGATRLAIPPPPVPPPARLAPPAPAPGAARRPPPLVPPQGRPAPPPQIRHVPAAEASDGAPTVELSRRDLEPTFLKAWKKSKAWSQSASQAWRRSRAWRRSASRAARRSILPWATAALFAAIGARMWLDAHPELTGGEPLEPGASTEAPAGIPPSSESTPAADGGGHAAPPEPGDSMSAGHRGKPANLGLGKTPKPAAHSHTVANPNARSQ